jgi:hypothetical protein
MIQKSHKMNGNQLFERLDANNTSSRRHCIKRAYDPDKETSVRREASQQEAFNTVPRYPTQAPASSLPKRRADSAGRHS